MADKDQKQHGMALGVQQMRTSLPYRSSSELLRLAREWEGQRVTAEQGSDYRNDLNKGLISIYRLMEKRLADDNQDRVLPLPAGRAPYGTAADVLNGPISGTIDNIIPFNRLDEWAAELQGFDSSKPLRKDKKVKQKPPRMPSRDREMRAPTRLRTPGPIQEGFGGAAVGRGLARVREYFGDVQTGVLDELMSENAKKPNQWGTDSYGNSAQAGSSTLVSGLSSYLRQPIELPPRERRDAEFARKAAIKAGLEAGPFLQKERLTSVAIRKEWLMQSIRQQGPLIRQWRYAVTKAGSTPVEAVMDSALNELARRLTSALRQAEAKTQNKGTEENRQELKDDHLMELRKKALDGLSKDAVQKLASLLR